MLNRHMIAAILAAILLSATITNDALAAPFQLGDFITYSQDSWGANPSGDAGALVVSNFDLLYPGGLEVGISGPAGYSMVFSGASGVLDYLPASGTPGPLNDDHLDPTNTSSGAFGGHVLALQLDVDFTDAGIFSGASNTLFGDLVIVDTVYPIFNGLTVRQFLANANGFLGGDLAPYSFDDLAFLTEDLTLAFEGGTPTQFAQDHLQLPDGVPQPVPEPATLGLLAIGLGGLTVRRFKGLRRQALRRFGVIGPLSLSVKVDTNPCG